MSKYVPNIIEVIEFQDDKITATLEPLDRESWMNIAASLGPVASIIHTDGGRDITRSQRAYETACIVLEKHLQKLDGLRDANGNAISISTVLTKMFFTELVNALFATLIKHSTLGKVMSTDSEAK